MPDISTLYGAIRTRLLAASPVTALVASRVYQGWVPRNATAATFPCVTLWEIDRRDLPVDQMRTGVYDVLFQVDAWATDFDVATALGAAVEDALNGSALAASGWKNALPRVVGSQRMYEEETGLNRRSIEVRVTALPG